MSSEIENEVLIEFKHVTKPLLELGLFGNDTENELNVLLEACKESNVAEKDNLMPLRYNNFTEMKYTACEKKLSKIFKADICIMHQCIILKRYTR